MDSLANNATQNESSSRQWKLSDLFATGDGALPFSLSMLLDNSKTMSEKFQSAVYTKGHFSPVKLEQPTSALKGPVTSTPIAGNDELVFTGAIV